MAIFNNDDIESAKKEDWHASVGKEKLLERYSDFHPSAVAILKSVFSLRSGRRE